MDQPFSLRRVVQRFVSIAVKLLGKHRLKVITLFFGVFIPFFIFGDLAEDVWDEGGFSWDIPILLAIHKLATPTLDTLVIAITNLGGPRILAPVVVAIVVTFILQRKYFNALFLGLATGGAGIINISAKLFFHRSRPSLWLSPVPEYDYGFPSGHAMGSMAVITALIILAWSTRWRVPVLISGCLFVALIGLSRLYLGVHFPSDVIAGWCASLCWVVGLYLILTNRLTQIQRRLSQDSSQKVD